MVELYLAALDMMLVIKIDSLRISAVSRFACRDNGSGYKQSPIAWTSALRALTVARAAMERPLATPPAGFARISCTINLKPCRTQAARLCN